MIDCRLLFNALLKPDIGKHPLDCLHHLYDARLINYRAIQTPYKGVNDLAAEERLGRKFTCAPFIPHGRGLMLNVALCVHILGFIDFFLTRITLIKYSIAISGVNICNK